MKPESSEFCLRILSNNGEIFIQGEKNLKQKTTKARLFRSATNIANWLYPNTNVLVLKNNLKTSENKGDTCSHIWQFPFT